MKQTARLTTVLGTTCLLAAVVLAVGNLVTEVPRQKAAARERQRNLRIVLPDFRNDPVAERLSFPVRNAAGQDAGTVDFYLARDAEQNGGLVAIAAEATSNRGYGGDVTVLAGLKPDGSLMQVLVTAHSETPGLGTRVTDRVRTRFIWQAFSGSSDQGLPPSAYLDQYSGRPAAALADPGFRVVKTAAEANDNAVMAVSGATISSRAVADAVSRICTAYSEHRAEFSLQ